MAGGVGQSDLHAVAELLDQLVFDVLLDRVPAGLAGEVGFVDQAAQRVGDLRGPGRVGIDLGGIIKITTQVSAAQLVGQRAQFGGVVVLAGWSGSAA